MIFFSFEQVFCSICIKGHKKQTLVLMLNYMSSIENSVDLLYCILTSEFNLRSSFNCPIKIVILISCYKFIKINKHLKSVNLL